MTEPELSSTADAPVRRRASIHGMARRLAVIAGGCCVAGAALAGLSAASSAPAAARGAGLGFGGVMLGAGAGLLVAGRGAWRRAITSALSAYAKGERRADALRVDPRLGDCASAWNAIVDTREEARRATVIGEAERAVAVGDRRRSSGTGPLDALWHGVLLLDEAGLIVEINGAASVLLGVGRDRLIGAAFSSIEGCEAVAREAGGVLAGATARASATVERRTDGQRSFLRLTIRRVRRDGPIVAMAVVEDVTQQHAAEEARASFVAHATHELRNPLTSIRLYVEEAIEVGETDAAVRSRALQVIQHESRRLERVIADMLSTSEIESGTLTLRRGNVELKPVFDELRSDFEPQAASKDIELVFDLPPKYPRAEADRDKLVLAIHNVIGNAIKYTPAGGRVSVRVEATEHELMVEVSDTGIGISPEAQPKVFDRFYRANDERVAGETGSGLGLALAREVVRLHGGEIELMSELNKGSTFTIRVPVTRGEDMARAA